MRFFLMLCFWMVAGSAIGGLFNLVKALTPADNALDYGFCAGVAAMLLLTEAWRLYCKWFLKKNRRAV